MQDTPRSNRLHIAIFGKRNAGKSSLINAITNQDIALVSNIAGTTTDPVYKAMEILPIGPVVIIDTAGLDDEGELGELRIKKTYQVLNKTELAIVLVNGETGITDYDNEIISRIKEKKIPLVGVVNKIDIKNVKDKVLNEWSKEFNIPFVKVSAETKEGIDKLKETIIKEANLKKHEKVIIGDLIKPHDIVVLVTPIDKAAPKGRLILPQQQTLRDIIDHGGIAVVTRETELKKTLKSLGKKPRLVVTDSQAFAKVDEDTPKDITLTSFSILFARYKGDLRTLVEGVSRIKELTPGDKVLICEGCTHHRQEGDIGKDKIPRWLENMVGGNLEFEWTSGTAYPQPEEMKKYNLIIHCGGCMLNPKEMEFRIQQAKDNGMSIVNYGVLIGYVTGVLERALEPFPEIKALLY
ncbi:[FeFe] hydrogenase H-cluster maturation GTPase HydF [Paramaledivibacter caminithermalis]|uniref:[FeFe] hydrogenase H-cluster maturation GTPase HydF n=1 Tax=Paramaledivibacter caminithermalis (strain DSM 15212 / CIP 107654 / DViRD3) TaxID=1121301 RepID=A0A1M6KVU1_PARC5|nr:[FeFe] hydrogenase H-cluster maturation GTPase HydF [Paramaledivibacter caminithermalis]SHJ63101.1 [FeFe] hydrogenase H-cluster maturation GTPase HydF [Paramaledivibacter caminithermalis DSM 15212]